MFTKEFFENLEKELLGNNLTKEFYIQVNVVNGNSIKILISDYNKYGVKFIDCISGILENIGVRNQSYIITKDDIELYRIFILNDYKI